MVDRALASDFVVLVLSEAVLSETVLVLDGCLNRGEYEYRFAEYEYEHEKKHEQSIGPKCSIDALRDRGW
jgi:hypothetical protein